MTFGYFSDPFNLRPSASDYGYKISPDLTLDEPDKWTFVHVGDVIQDDDEVWRRGVGPWMRIGPGKGGITVSEYNYPFRRRRVLEDPQQWSCRAKYTGHRRESGSTFCPICAVLYNRRIID